MLRNLIKKSYFINKALLWQTHKDISKSRIKYINSLFGYKRLPNIYCVIKYSNITSEGLDTEKYAYLLPEYDGILFVFLNYYNNILTTNSILTFTGKSRFISKNNILNLSIENQKGILHKKNYKLVLKYKFRNKTIVTCIKPIILNNPNKKNPIKQLQQQYMSDYLDSNNIYINRMTIKNKKVIQYAENNTIKDWVNHSYTFKEALQVCFEYRTCKIESKSEFLFSFIIILIFMFMLSIALIALAGFCHIIILGFIMVAFALIIGTYYMILNIIRRLHDINLSSFYSILLFIPLANIILLIVLCSKPSKFRSKESVEDIINNIVK